jgi:cobalt/nickel transport system permease protein
MTLPARRPDAVPDSPVARWDPRWKLAAVLVAAAGLAAVERPGPAAAGFALAVGLAVLARLPVRQVRDRLGLLLLAAAPFLILLPFTVAGPGWGSERGLAAAAAVGCRCLGIGTLALVLTATAPLPRTLAAGRALGLPGPVVLVAQLAHRYTAVLAGEARRLRTALRVRAFRPRTDAHTYRTLGHAAGALLVRGGERAERVAAAMRARGFDGTARGLDPFRTTAADVLGFAAAIMVTAAVVAWDRLT